MTFRILITGSRDWDDAATIRTALDKYGWQHDWQLTVVHGAAVSGADAIAAAWCREVADQGVVEEPHPVTAAQWRANPLAAGPMRNVHMVGLGADVCLAFIARCVKRGCPRPQPHGSHGATHCLTRAAAAGIPTRKWVVP